MNFLTKKNRLISNLHLNTVIILIFGVLTSLVFIVRIFTYLLPEINKKNVVKNTVLESPIRSYVFDITNEPYEIQIQRAEKKYKPKNLKGINSELRNEFTWLVALWFAKDKTFNVLGEKDTVATATRIYRAIEWIEDATDKRRKDNELKSAWTTASESIRIDLSQDDAFNRSKSYNSLRGSNETPLTYLRSTLIHEFVHFIGKQRSDALSFSILKQSKPEYRQYIPRYIEGFKIGFFPVPDNTLEHKGVEFLVDFDEAATELIATSWQKASGWEIVPTYSPDVNKAIDLFQKIIDHNWITFIDLAIYKANSDLDGLAIKFAEATDQQFVNNEAKVHYGLWVVSKIEKGDSLVLEKFIDK